MCWGLLASIDKTNLWLSVSQKVFTLMVWAVTLAVVSNRMCWHLPIFFLSGYYCLLGQEASKNEL